MDATRFDVLTRKLAVVTSRRGILGILGGLVAGVLTADETSAAPRRRLCFKPGQGCRRNRQCCSGRCRNNLCQHRRRPTRAKRCRGATRRCGRRCVQVRTNRRHCGRCNRRCSPGESCRQGRCVAPPLPACGEGGPCTVFVTSTVHDGALSGLAGADAICAERASQAGLSGTYRAWLADDEVSPATRFHQNAGPYRRVDGAVIAQNWAELTGGSLRAPIRIDEQGNDIGDIIDPDSNPPRPYQVWTHTEANGQGALGASCDQWHWQPPDAGACNRVGQTNATNATWTATPNSISCHLLHRLYCFQQPS